MDEKIYKTMGSAGASTLAVGICVLAGGITPGPWGVKPPPGFF